MLLSIKRNNFNHFFYLSSILVHYWPIFILRKKDTRKPHENFNTPPLTYAVTDIEDRDQLELKLVIGERTIKEKLPIYRGDSEETLLILVKEYKNLIDTYDLWDQENADRNVYFDFRRCLRDSARDD